MPGSWRRYAPFLAQVGFLVGDLRRKMGSYALHWRRSPPFFLTCANIPLHLRQNIGTCTGFQRHLRQKHRHLRQNTHTPAPRSGEGEQELLDDVGVNEGSENVNRLLFGESKVSDFLNDSVFYIEIKAFCVLLK